MQDYDVLYNKLQDMKNLEQHLRDALEAAQEIRYDGMEAFRVDLQDKIYEIRDNQRKIEASMDVVRIAEEQANGTDRPAVDWR